MSTKKKIVCIIGFILIAFLVSCVFHINNAIGGIDSDKNRDSKYSKYSYYNDQNHQFESSEELVYYPEKTTGGDAGWLRFFKTSPNAPKHEIPKVLLTKNDFSDTPSSFALYWLGHSSAILEIDTLRILIDPVLVNAAPFPGLTPRYTASPIERNELPDIDIVLITHDHYDHLETKTIEYLKDKVSMFVVPLGVGARLKSWGVAESKIKELGWYEDFKDLSLVISACPTIHYSGRSMSDRNKTLWCSYVIKGRNNNIFWSGDSGYGDHFKEIASQYGPFDLACIEIDAWNAGWPNTHLFPEDVINVCKDMNIKKLLPIHWGVFDLALHPWNESIQEIYNLTSITDIKLLTPMMGEKVLLDKEYSNQWWKNNN